MAYRILDNARRNRIRDGLVPYVTQLVEGTAHADPVDLTACGQRAHDDRDVVLASFAVDDIGEEECFAIALFDAAPELPPDEWMHLRVLVDRTVDRYEQACIGQRFQMLMEIRIGGHVAGSISRGFRGLHGFIVSRN